MKLLLLGKDGQIGTELRRSLLPLGPIQALGRNDLCLSNLSAVASYLKNFKPDLIVNAAAYTAVDKAETEAKLAHTINADLVGVLADYAKQFSSLLIHYSTDYVFDGTNDNPYKETDSTNPLNNYGLSKRAGELVIMQSDCNYLILRTSWVYSTIGTNFIKTILKLAETRSHLNVIDDQLGAPTSAELIADISALAILGYKKEQISKGIYHLTASGYTSWYKFAHYIVSKASQHDLVMQLKAENIKPISTEEYPTLARRPKNSRLDSTAITKALDLNIAQWQVYVDRIMNQFPTKGINV